ncbi:MAG TPA: opioid growth factor receptor-related protein [Acidobacteriaceae bacterium]|nr:opioid growth factor receptor-related protein [Acidobacteriaceae bacterium]
MPTLGRHPRTHPIVAFYRDAAPDDRNRTLAEILTWDDHRLETVHDFIQWLFPLPEPSGANPSAPTLDQATIVDFHTTPEMQQRLRQSFDRMMRFYGFAWTSSATPGPDPSLIRAQDFQARAENWLYPMNHNHLRLTRILRSTLLLRLESESKALFQALNALYREYPNRIPARTHAYWSNAAQTS